MTAQATKVCVFCGVEDDGHRLDCPAIAPPPYTGDEPLGTCPLHGDYWTDDCIRCGR